MDAAEVWALLELQRAVVPDHFEAGGLHRVRRFEGFDPLIDPVATERLGTALAARLAGPYDLVAVWDTLDAAVLGYVVGRALERPVVRIFDHEGLITASAPIAPGSRAVFVTPAISDPQEPRLTRALLEARDAHLAAVAALVDLANGAEPTVALVRVETYPPAQCPACQQGQPLSNARQPLAPGGHHG